MNPLFIVTEKDGQKWLQPINVPYPNADEYEDGNEPGPFSARADAFIYLERTTPILYLGLLLVGTIIDEGDVELWQQYQTTELGCLTWFTAENDAELNEWRDRNPDGFKTRTVYVDTDLSYTNRIKAAMPLIKFAADEMRESSYWQKRCEAAEKLIGISPSDPKSYPEYCRLMEEWVAIKNEKQ